MSGLDERGADGRFAYGNTIARSMAKMTPGERVLMRCMYRALRCHDSRFVARAHAFIACLQLDRLSWVSR